MKKSILILLLIATVCMAQTPDRDLLIDNNNVRTDAGIVAQKLDLRPLEFTNMVDDSSFEDWTNGAAAQPDGWTAESTPTVARDTAETGHGAYNLKITGAGAANEGSYQTLTNLKPSKIYRLICRAKATSGDYARMLTTGATVNADVETASTNWTDLVDYFTTDGSGTNVVLKLVAKTSGDIVWFDDVQATESITKVGFMRDQATARTALGTIYEGGTEGSVIFVSGVGDLAEDNSNFFWDDTNNLLSIGTAAPSTSGGTAGDGGLLVGALESGGWGTIGMYRANDDAFDAIDATKGNTFTMHNTSTADTSFQGFSCWGNGNQFAGGMYFVKAGTEGGGTAKYGMQLYVTNSGDSGATLAIAVDSGAIVSVPVSIKVDTIDEYTSAAGTTIEGNLLKDSTAKTEQIIFEGGTFDTTIDPGTPTESVTYTWPLAAGSPGQALAIQAANTLYWGDPTPAAHTHDGDTLQFDAVNSDGGAFSFSTTGAVTFNQLINATDIYIQDNGYIGSASDHDALRIMTAGDIYITQDLSVAGVLDMNSQLIHNVADAIDLEDAVNLNTLLDHTGIDLNYWLGGTTLDLTLTDSEASYTEVTNAENDELTNIYFKSSLAETPSPFLIKAGTIIGVHWTGDETSGAGRNVGLYFQLGYVNADGTTTFVQIGSNSDTSDALTSSKTAFSNHIHVASDTTIPSGKRLWLKVFSITVSGAGGYPTIRVYYDNSSHHMSLEVAGSVLGTFVKADGTTPMTANWDIGNYTLTANGVTIDGTFTDGTASLASGSLTSVKLGTLTNNGLIKTTSGDGTLATATADTDYLVTLLKDVVATTPLLVNATTNVDDILPGANSDLTFSMPAATNAVAGYATAAQITALEANTAKVTESTSVTSPLVLSTYDISIPAATNAAAGHASAAHITAIEANTAHISADGSSHTFLDQSVVSGSTPTLTATNITGVPAASILAGTFGTGAYVFDNAITGVTDLTIAGSLLHTGDADTHIAFTSDVITFTYGGTAVVASEIAANTAKNSMLAAVAAGDMIYCNDGTNWGIISKGTDNHVMTMNGNYPNWEAGGAGSGDVTAGAVMTDHSIVRGDGGAKGVQDSGIIIDDSDNVSSMGTLSCGVITQSATTLANTYHALTTVGIADNNLVEIDSATVATDEYARFTANGLESLSKAEVIADLVDVVQASDTIIVDNDTLVLTFAFVPSEITITYSARSAHVTDNEKAVTVGRSLITITGVDTFTENTNSTAAYDFNGGVMSADRNQNNTTNVIRVFGGYDGATEGSLLGTGAWVTANKQLTITFQETNTSTGFNFVEMVATAYR